MKKDKNPPIVIEVGVYWYKDDDGNIVYDTEEMQREFDEKLKKLEEE
jgi:hypothetical protein